ncbi:MAG: hypothetical protein IRY94_17170 [Rhodospirillaceae bacterium]|nr:hypothetical protein [Rhodospirillaceae bacterium]
MAIPRNSAPSLPVLATVRDAFRLLWALRDDFLRLATIPVALTLLVNLLGFGMGAAAPGSFQSFLLSVPVILLTTLFSVGWLRVLLLPEDRTRRDFGLRWTRRHTQFLWRSLVLVLGALLVLMIAEVLGMGVERAAPGDEPAGVIAILPVGLATLAAAYVALRLSLVFPAAAIDHEYGFARSWRDTRHCGVALTVVSAILVGLSLLAANIVGLVAAVSGFQSLAPMTTMLVLCVIEYLLTATSLAALSIAFQRFSGWAGGAADHPAGGQP